MIKRDAGICSLILSFPLILALRTGYIVDDAFISFRYAKNLARGLGLVFNPGERVEGYTNFLWTLLMALPIELGVDPLLFARVLSTAAGLGTLLLLVRFLRKRGDTRPATAPYTAPIILAVQAPFTVWLLAGLETHLFAFLVTAGVLSYLLEREKKNENTGLPRWPVILVLASLTRPEGLLFLGIAWLLSLADTRGKSRHALLRHAFTISLPFLLLFVPWLAWKYFYYGSLVPNTFHAKVGSSTSQVIRGLWYVRAHLFSGGYVLLLAAAGLAFIPRRRAFLRYCLAFILPYFLYVVLVGGDSMVKFRFILPVLPLLSLLASTLLIDVSSLSGREFLRHLTLAVLTIIIAALSFDGDRALVLRRREMVKDWIEVGRWLGSAYDPGTTMALGAVGAIAYYSDLRTIDIFGLTDPTVAGSEIGTMGRGLPGHERADGAYVLSLEPDLILPKVVLSGTPPPPGELGVLFSGSRAEAQIWRHPSFRKHYRPVQVDLERGTLTYFTRVERGDETE